MLLEWALMVQKPTLGPVSFSLCLLPVDQDVKLSGTLLHHHVCLPPAMILMGEAFETISKLQLNVSFNKSCLGHGVISQYNSD